MIKNLSIFLFCFLFLIGGLLFVWYLSREEVFIADHQGIVPPGEAGSWREFGGKLTIGQTFLSPSQKLAMIRVYVSNPKDAVPSAPIFLFIKERPEEGDYLIRSSQTLESLQDKKYMDFIIDPELSLTNQKLYFYLEALDLPKEKYLQARTESEARSYAEGNLYWNHKEKSADLIFALFHKESKLQYYLGKFWQNNIKRISQGVRGIIWLAAIIVLLYALVKFLFVKKIQNASRVSR